MALVNDIAVWILLGLGSFFYLVGAIGLVRMPDLFTRMHAASVSETLGAGLLLLAMMLAAGWSLNAAKLAVILGIHSKSSADLLHGRQHHVDRQRVQRHQPRGDADELALRHGEIVAGRSRHGLIHLSRPPSASAARRAPVGPALDRLR